jgi:hypothetical protein
LVFVAEDWFYDGGTFVAWSDDPLVTNELAGGCDGARERPVTVASAWEQDVSDPLTDNVSAAVTPARVFLYLEHSPRPMLKSRRSVKAPAPELFESVRSTVFRAWDKTHHRLILWMRWALAWGGG